MSPTTSIASSSVRAETSPYGCGRWRRERLIESPNAPFDADEGVLIACQRHFAMMPADTVFEVRAIEASGAERTAVYTIPHVFQD